MGTVSNKFLNYKDLKIVFPNIETQQIPSWFEVSIVDPNNVISRQPDELLPKMKIGKVVVVGKSMTENTITLPVNTEGYPSYTITDIGYDKTHLSPENNTNFSVRFNKTGNNTDFSVINGNTDVIVSGIASLKHIPPSYKGGKTRRRRRTHKRKRSRKAKTTKRRK